jgi:hypothetical protein
MGRISARIATILLALFIAIVGLVGAFALSCTALYAFMADTMPPPLAALAASAIVFATALLLVLLVLAIGWRGGRRRGEDSLFVAGRAIGSLLADRAQEFADENPPASLLMSLLAGFIAGARK